MNVMAEICYYPFTKEDYKTIIGNVMDDFSLFDLQCEFTPMSTIVTGEHKEVLKLVESLVSKHFSKNPSILELKLSNACF